MENVKLSISGMACQGCADSLTRLFDKEPGVSSASVSFESSLAEITFDPAKVSETRLSEIVRGAGFGLG